MIELRNVSYEYPTGEQALTELSLTIEAGKRVALVGTNGSGKSTLVRHLNGLLRPKSGTIYFHNNPIQYNRKGLRQLRQQVGLIFQEAENQLFAATVVEDIAFGPLNLGLDEIQVRERVGESAELLQITSLLDRPIHALSGGQKMRVAIAGVLAMRPQLLIADEPLASLDDWIQRRLLSLFGNLVTQGRTVLLVTHDLNRAYSWADEVIVLQAGRLLAQGSPIEILGDEEILATCGWEMPWVLALAKKLKLTPTPRTREQLFTRL